MTDYSRPLCLDASVALKWGFMEPLRPEALRLRALADLRRVELFQPDHFPVECISGGLHHLRRGQCTLTEAVDALADLFTAPFRLVPVASHVPRILELAHLTGLTAWDAAYLAVAESIGAEFWTADAELAQMTKPHLPFVRLLGEDLPSQPS